MIDCLCYFSILPRVVIVYQDESVEIWFVFPFSFYLFKSGYSNKEEKEQEERKVKLKLFQPLHGN